MTGIAPQYGIKTGLNEAFLIDGVQRQKLIAEDAKSDEIIRPYLRGSDISRWKADWVDTWIIFPRRGIAIDDYPAVKRHLTAFREKLEPKPTGWSGAEWSGRKPGNYQWFEIQDPVEYWKDFAKPKIFYQVIQFHPRYAVDTSGLLWNDKTFFIPSDDAYLAAVLNSPLMWWYNWRTLTHLKDEALSPLGYMLAELPIAETTPEIRAAVETAVRRLIEITASQQQTQRNVLDWLRMEYAIEKPNQKLAVLTDLDSDAFVAEIKKLRGKKQPLTAASLAALRTEYAQSIDPARALAAEALQLERTLSDLINTAYGLTPEEVKLMWATAPPRMPFQT